MSEVVLGVLKNVFLASILISIVCGVVGSLVYSNRLTFMSGGIAHAAYGGIGLAIFFHTHVLVTVFIFTGLMALFMGFLTRKERGKIDSVVGLVWAGGMALGIVLMDLTPGYHADLMSYLFGSITLISKQTIWFMSLLSLIVLFIVAMGYHKFEAISFDHEFACVRGIEVSFFYYLLLLLVAICVVMLIELVGIILVIALLSIPPYLSSYTAKTMKGMMFYSFLWSVMSCFTGIGLSYYFNLSSGASIVIVCVVLGFLFLGIRKICCLLTCMN